MMVLRRWAMVRTVQSSNCVRIVDWMSVSVSRSTAAVASSKTKILVFLSKALARQTSWRWPRLHGQRQGGSGEPQVRFYTLYSILFYTSCSFVCIRCNNTAVAEKKKNKRLCPCAHLRFSPPSEHSWLSLSGRLETKFLRWASSSERHTSSSV